MKTNWRSLCFLMFVFMMWGCAESEPVFDEAQQELVCEEPVGLGVYFMNGVWNPDMSPLPDPARPTTLSVTKGPERFVEEIYIGSFLPTTEVDGPNPVIETGDFAGLDWSGLQYDSTDWRFEANGQTYQRQVFYRGAVWMEEASSFNLKFRKANGDLIDNTRVKAGLDNEWRDTDDFGERRFIVRVLSTGCVAEGDCTNPEAQHFAEALVQLRVALHPEDSFVFPNKTATVDLKWSAYEGHVWTVPVVVSDPTPGIDYGLEIVLETVNPPSRGYYLPGEQVQVRHTFKDGSGNALFAQGSMPSYLDVVSRQPSAKGIRYLTFNGTPMLYWAHKPLQGAMQTFFAGPVQNMTNVGSAPITPFSFFLPEVQVPSATKALDGWTGLVQETPVTPQMFSCFGGDFAACTAPVSDVFVYTIPMDADSGTYVAGVKARREYQGEPAMTAASINIQVGSSTQTYFQGFPIPGLGNCGSCHQDEMALPKSGHGFAGNKVGPQCLACHTDGYYFEPDAGIVTRLTYLHAQSDRLGPP